MKYLLLILFIAGCAGKDVGERDKCFGSGGTHYVYDAATNTGQCVYDAPGTAK